MYGHIAHMLLEFWKGLSRSLSSQALTQNTIKVPLLTSENRR